MTPALQLLTGFVTLAALIAGAVWSLSARITTGNTEVATRVNVAIGELTAQMHRAIADLTANIAHLQVDVAVMKTNERSRDEKINQLWNWKIKELEEGWVTAQRANMPKVGQ